MDVYVCRDQDDDDDNNQNDAQYKSAMTGEGNEEGGKCMGGVTRGGVTEACRMESFERICKHGSE